MNYQPALGSNTGAHFDLGVDQLATPVEIVDMHDPWVGQQPTHPVAAAPTAEIPQGDIAPWASTMQLPGV